MPTDAAPTDRRRSTAPWRAATLFAVFVSQVFARSTSSHQALASGVRVEPAGASPTET